MPCRAALARAGCPCVQVLVCGAPRWRRRRGPLLGALQQGSVCTTQCAGCFRTLNLLTPPLSNPVADKSKTSFTRVSHATMCKSSGNGVPHFVLVRGAALLQPCEEFFCIVSCKEFS